MGCCSSKTPRNSTNLPASNLITLKNKDLMNEYEIQNTIGEGAFSQVRLAKHILTGVHHAVKTIHISNSISLDQIQQEIDIMKQIDHPNIVKVFQVFHDGPFVHIAMEYCSGGELFDRIVQQKPFSENQAAKYFIDIVAAISYLHSIGIVHRDLKPENLLMETHSAESGLKLADFGSAANFTKTRLKYTSSSVYYVAPEVFEETYDEKCDVWSAGVILYLMLCGVPPFNDHSERMIKKKIKNKPLEFRELVWGTVSEEVKELLRKMLTKSPLNRPSMSEVMRDVWVVNRSTGTFSDRILAVETFNNFKAFSVQSKIHRVTLDYIALEMIERDQSVKIREFFEAMDVNRDGKLSKAELKKGIEKLELKVKDVDGLIEKCDTDGNGYIDYSEFVTASIDWNRELSTEKLEMAFRAFDIDKNGKISLKELHDIFGEDERNEHYFMEILQEADTDEDGEIDFKEFCEFIVGKNEEVSNRI